MLTLLKLEKPKLKGGIIMRVKEVLKKAACGYFSFAFDLVN